jgi:hypothetical protein
MAAMLSHERLAALDFTPAAAENAPVRHTLTFLALAAVTACSAAKTIDFTSSASSSGSTSTAGTGAGTGGTASASTAGTGAVHLGAGGGGVGGGSGTGGSTANAEVFGQSAGTLYKLDPITKVVTTVGDFQGCGDEVIDIALDKDSNMYGTSTDGVYKIDKTTAVCTQIAAGSYPNSLSFVPAGTLDPNVEALVGYLGNQYVRIDTTTGAVTNVGNKSLGACQSSGDIVSVIGGGTYLTVTGCIGCLDSDCIVEVDPKTGALVKNLGKVGHIAVYGLAFWGGSAYGFDAAGQLFQIDLMNGTSTTIPIPMAPPGLSFYGAGSSTSVPLMPPT